MNIATLKEILSDQREELKMCSSQNFCERAEEKKVNLNSKKAQVVIGVRRSGKSVLCYNALSKSGVNFAYANFDDERLANLTSEDLNDVLKCLYQIYGDFTHLFLDEAQNIDGWHLFVNRLLRQGLRVVITGSNAKLLSSELSTHLTGRYSEIELYPFSFREYCELKQIETTYDTTKADAFLRKAFDEYMAEGGFPEVANGEEQAEEYINTLVSNILDRDIVRRFNVRYSDAFKKLSHHLMNNAPCEVVYTTLQKEFNFKTDHTVENYVGYLYQAFLLAQLKKYSTKSSIRVRNAKCYTIDVSLLNARKDALAKENLGWRLETIVFLELKRRYSVGYDIYYYSDGTAEADFIVCHRSVVEQVIQVSYDISSPKTLNRELSGLIKASKATNCDCLLLITAYDEETKEYGGKRIDVVPCYKWLLRGEVKN